MKKRKPLLRLRILRALVSKGQLTKKDTELYFKEQAVILGETRRPHYKEISDAFDALYKKKYVRQQNTNLAKGKPYALTNEGLNVLIYESNSEKECWSYVIQFCANMKNQSNLTSYSEFSKILNEFREKFLPYKSIGNYSHILKVFNAMSRKLLTELNEDNLVVELLLTLARRKEMTITEIETKMKKEERTIKETLEMLSMVTHRYTPHYSLEGGDDIDWENQRRRYIDFLQHCLIFFEQRNGNRYYRISLFGILFLVNSLRMKDKNSAKERNGTSFEEALKDIAAIHHDKLPLIFGKWDVLKKFLNLLSIYNFDFLLNKEESFLDTNELIELGYSPISYDNKLIENIYPMYVLNNIEWANILDEGTKILDEVESSNLFEVSLPRWHEFKEEFLANWYGYFRFRRKLLHVEAGIDEIFDGIRMHEQIYPEKFAFAFDVLYHKEDYLLPLKLIEKAFEDEVTIIYYLKLTDSYFWPLYYDDGMTRLTSSLAEGKKDLQRENISIRNDSSPRERLRLIVTRDKQIRNYLTQFMNDMSSYLKYQLSDTNNLADSLELVVRKAAG